MSKSFIICISQKTIGFSDDGVNGVGGARPDIGVFGDGPGAAGPELEGGVTGMWF